MKTKSSNLVMGLIIFALFLVIFCSMLVFTVTVMGIAYGIHSSIQGTPLVGYSATPGMNTEVAMVTETAMFTATPGPTLENTITPTMEIPTETPTETLPPTETLTPTFTETPLPPTETPTPTIDATALANEMISEIQTLYDSGIITTMNGQYYQLPEYHKSWNELGDYEQTETDFRDMSDFVLRADAAWSVDGNSGDWRESGCGIIFRQDVDSNHYLVYYSLDGRARLFRDLQGGSNLLGRTTIYDVDRENGYGKIMIVVEGEYINLYFNEKEIFRKRDPWIHSGALTFTVVSGNMNGYGTQCNLSNVELWEIQH